jgi:hypothetical protein
MQDRSGLIVAGVSGRDGWQLFSAVGQNLSVNDQAWKEFRQALPDAVHDTERKRLLQEYEPLMKERLDLGRHAGALPRAGEPVYRWVRYKEAYSPQLVRDVLDDLLPGRGTLREEVVYDPMAGSGTSLLVAAERGLPALGADLLPYAAFVSSTMIRWREADPARVLRTGEDALARYGSFPDDARLDVPAARWAFSPAVAGSLTGLLNALAEAPGGVERDLVRLAVLSAVEQVSYAVKDGTSLRRRLPGGPSRPGRPGQQREEMGMPDVVAGVRRRIGIMAADLEDARSASRGIRGSGAGSRDTEAGPAAHISIVPGDVRSPTAVVQADARRWRPAQESCSAVVFSPPYPNRYDYSAIYQLELALGGFVPDAAGLRRVRKQLLRSHLEAPPRGEYAVQLPALREFLSAVNGSRAKGDQAGRVLRMVAGFFEDMADVLSQVARAMRPGASAAVVIATQTYFGQHLPTDLLLAELGRDAGLEVRALWLLRSKGVASQQRGISSAPSREMVLVLRKPPVPEKAVRAALH